MNDRQKFALRHPMQNAFAPPNPKCRRFEKLGKKQISTVLTVDSTGGKLAWHASVALIGKDGQTIKPIGNIMAAQMNQILNLLKDLLEGVGEGKVWTFPPNFHVHLFRELSAEERMEMNKYSPSLN